jgi:prevent-host-death family protein
MNTLTANDLKTKGITAIEGALDQQREAIITVHGKPRYVVVDIAQYDYLRECELEAAWHQVREEVAAGRYQIESAEAHMERVRKDLADGV